MEHTWASAAGCTAVLLLLPAAASLEAAEHLPWVWRHCCCAPVCRWLLGVADTRPAQLLLHGLRELLLERHQGWKPQAQVSPKEV